MENKKIKTSIGGQALMEGILMRGPKKTAIAIRLPDKSIYVEELETEFLKDKYKIFKLPFFRGIGSLIDSLKIGKKAMMISVQKAMEAKNELEKKPKEDDVEEWLNKRLGKNITKALMGVASILGAILSIFLFLFLPSWISNIALKGASAFGNVASRSLLEGIIKFLIFLLYLVGISKMKDIKRVFMYHGAEHKTIFCYENRKDLTVENVKKFKRFHPRCGTSFLVLMLIVGIFLGIFIPFTNPLARTITRVACMPLFVALGFELIKLCSKYDNFLTKLIAKPGLLMQRISTKDPEDGMMEVAIEAIKRVIPENGEDQIQ